MGVPDFSSNLQTHTRKLTHAKKHMADSQVSLEMPGAEFGLELDVHSSSSALLESLRDFFVEDDGPGESPGEPHSLLERVDAQLAMVDSAFSGISMNNRQDASARAVLLLFPKGSNEAKNELLVTMLFTSISRGKYRAHFEEEAYVYTHGSWRRVSSLPYEALEFATTAFREADRCFALMQNEFLRQRERSPQYRRASG